MPAWLTRPLRPWQRGTLDREALYAAAHAQAAAPGHVDVAKRLAGAVLDLLDRMPLTRRVMHDTPMYLLLVCCMALHHGRDPADAAGGITLKSLRALFDPGRAPLAFAGDSHVRDMMSWARVCGLLAPAALGEDALDKRVRRYQPTAALEELFRAWIAAFLRSIDPPLPWPWPAAQPQVDDVYEVLSLRIQAFTRDGFILTERHPLVQQFMLKRHGYHVFLALVEGMQQQPDGSAVAPLSISALAERFEVARGTIRNSVELAAHGGYLRFEQRRNTVWLSRDFVQYALSWMALEMTYMHGMCVAAQARRTLYTDEPVHAAA